MEYPQFDRYLTWGWTKFPEGRGMGHVKAVVLPSPWLSRRREQWRRDVDPGPGWWERECAHDVLLMSNKVYAYPPAPSGGAVSRGDHAAAFAAELKDFVVRSRSAGVSILHKSFNAPTMKLLAGTLSELRVLGGDRYAHVEQLNKGLSPGLISRARLVLWDQPGTGFLECLTSGLPTMVLWSRLYNREAPWSREAFAALERVGIVHRDADAALAEFARFKAGPTAWMRDEVRAKAIEAFCLEYALIDDDWRKSWKRFVREACSRR
ncbi:MAG: hypothetical protein M0D55_02060 [Elusimicrobiota bacterium]|nr:MAG: hypothetical protein M0D55_02060 [Elusimicrobiota bacterium]